MHRLSLFCLSFLAFCVRPLVAQLRNETVSFTDSSLSFSSGWQASRDQASGDLFFRFDNVGVTALVITVPPLVSRITYTGLGRSSGSLYGVCKDCNDDFSTVSLFDAHDPTLTDDSLAVPVTIFSLDLDPNVQHVITILNIGDPKFNSESELTFVTVTFTFGDIQTTTTTSTSSSTSTTLTTTTSSTSTSISTSASTTSSLATTVLSSTSISSTSTSETATASAEPANAALSSSTRTSIIAVISILAVIALGSLLIGLFFYRRRRARRKSQFQLPSHRKWKKFGSEEYRPEL